MTWANHSRTVAPGWLYNWHPYAAEHTMALSFVQPTLRVTLPGACFRFPT
jgi:hypothetical protein